MHLPRISEFQEQFPSLESYWRSAILFGRNSSTYKFALARALEDLAREGRSEVALDEIAVPFSRHMCEHLLEAPKQSTGHPGKFIETCSSFNRGTADEQALIDTAVSDGFSYVLRAFHNVNGAELPLKFFEVSGNGRGRRVTMSDNLFRTLEVAPSVGDEAEARWRLVESAWEMGVSTSLVSVSYDGETETLLRSTEDAARRKSLVSARAALNGYQKGQCFYCYDTIELDGENSCDVDHFFPHVLAPSLPGANIDGVWNLVLACRECNRGEKGKFARVPDVNYLERLCRRNEFLISSHHPLREVIIAQTGATEKDRRSFLSHIDREAVNVLIHRWSAPARGAPTF